jgi:hypothetical protein
MRKFSKLIVVPSEKAILRRNTRALKEVTGKDKSCQEN